MAFFPLSLGLSFAAYLSLFGACFFPFHHSFSSDPAHPDLTCLPHANFCITYPFFDSLFPKCADLRSPLFKRASPIALQTLLCVVVVLERALYASFFPVDNFLESLSLAVSNKTTRPSLRSLRNLEVMPYYPPVTFFRLSPLTLHFRASRRFPL